MNLHLVQSIDPKTGGGIASSCIELVEAQNSIGLAAKIVSTTANRDELKSHDYKRLALIKCSNPILYTPDLKKLIEDVNSDWLIHSHGLYMYSSYLGTWIKRRHHNRMIVHVHGILEPWILSRSKITKKIASLLYENFKFRNAEYWRALTSKEADQIRREIAKNTTVLEPIDEDKFLCCFSHIFAGGYSAGYYSYKWAEVLSADAFSMFEEVDLENIDNVKSIGKKFKDTILSLGGSLAPLEIFKLFRGREPSTDSLIKHLGLSATD